MSRRVLRNPYANHAARAEEMRRAPGTWVETGTYNSRQSAAAVVRGIQSATIRAYCPAGSFEGATRMVEDGYAVDARYVGGER